jgi:hypothetical protein
VRDRGSGRGGRRGGRGRAPWWRGDCCGVVKEGEQVEKAATGVALMEEDNDGEIPWPSFTSRHCRQALSAGGAR